VKLHVYDYFVAFTRELKVGNQDFKLNIIDTAGQVSTFQTIFPSFASRHRSSLFFARKKAGHALFLRISGCIVIVTKQQHLHWLSSSQVHCNTFWRRNVCGCDQTKVTMTCLRIELHGVGRNRKFCRSSARNNIPGNWSLWLDHMLCADCTTSVRP